MQPKFQVFISSTYEDLRTERDQVIKATLEMGHIPVGMEMFSAADEEQWKLITRTIDQSDYYVVIVAHRYGSTVNNVSYTEMEYDYAVQQGLPVIGFVLDDAARWPNKFTESDVGKQTALAAFKAKVRGKPVGFWTSAEELHGRFSIALMKLIATNPRPGWARATEMLSPAVMTELSRLSSENADLRKHIAESKQEQKAEERAGIERTVRALTNNTRALRVRKKDMTAWDTVKDVTLLDIFQKLAPELLIEKSTESSAKTLATVMAGIKVSQQSTTWPIASNVLKAWLGDLAALDLVEPSSRKHALSDTNEYWTLTTYGREVYSRLRRTVLEGGLSSATVQEEEQEQEQEQE